MAQNILLRRANKDDESALLLFLSLEENIHRHLDWRTALDWLGAQPYWLLTHDGQILAVLACPPDPPTIAWIRLFAASNNVEPIEAWRLLFQKALNDLTHNFNITALAAVSLHQWFTDILEKNEFQKFQDIVILERLNIHPKFKRLPPDYNIRPMSYADLPAVEVIDKTAFESFWQLSIAGLAGAYKQSAYSTIVESAGKTIAYQISTQNSHGAHLARLAVHPDSQKQHIGEGILGDMLEYYYDRDVNRVTVNTQRENLASITLYKNLDFVLQDEMFPVFAYRGAIK